MYALRFLGRREYALAAVGLAFIVIQVYLDLRLPDYMADITRLVVTAGTPLGAVLSQGGRMLACAIGSVLCAVVAGFCVDRIGTTLSKNLRSRVFDKTLSLSSAELGKFSTPSLITRSTNDITQVQLFVVMGSEIFVKSPILAIWAIAKIAGKNMTWTYATATAVAILVTLLTVLTMLALPRMMRVQRITDDLNRVTREHLTGLRVIRAYGSWPFHGRRFERTNAELTGTNMFIMKAFALLFPALTALMSALSLSIYWLGGGMIDAASGSERLALFSNMIVFTAYAMQVIGAFMMMAMIVLFLPQARVSWRRIREVLDSEVSIASGTARVGAGAPGKVEFRDVYMRYPGAEDDVLKGVSFTAEPGKTVAIIGATGSGKSSIGYLIERFYDVRAGQVLVEGRDVREWDLEALRDRISYVPQKAVLFSGTVASNVAFGSSNVEVTPERIFRAARVSAAEDFVGEKEDGFASSVAQGGSNFSGGQKQRLAIARAVARGGSIMFFDDSFSALDYKTDRDVRAALRQECGEATVIVVSQRIGTVRTADEILVVEGGKIVGRGRHAELLRSCDVYEQIARSQMGDEERA